MNSNPVPDDGAIAPRFLTIPEAAVALRHSRSVLYQLIAAGRLKTVTVGRRRLVPVTAIDDYARSLASQEDQ